MDRNLLEGIYGMYAEEIRLYLYSLCKDAVRAEDMMQEVFVKALLSLSDDHENFRAWLYLVARNLCINEMKKERRRQKQVAENARKREENYNGMAENTEFSATEPDIVFSILREERKRSIFKCLMHLPEIQREAVYMFYFGEMSTGKIARVLELSPENVRVILYRARKNMKHLLEKEGYHEF